VAVAEQERLTKKERRERARAERKAKEAEAATKARRQRLIATVVAQALRGGTEAAATTIDRDAAEAGRQAAGCEVVDTTALASREHLDPATAPPADTLYTGIRPTHSGPHYDQTSPTVSFTDRQLDERATTHNLEHGAIIVWYDPEQVDDATLGELEAWADRLDASGFDTPAGGAVMVSAYTDPGIDSGKAFALRAWSVAVDCDGWDEDAYSSFVIENYGTNGVAPERNLSRYPDEALGYSDGEGPEADPDAGDGGAGEVGTMVPTEGDTPVTEEPASEDG
jgi:hypothetical protein